MFDIKEVRFSVGFRLMGRLGAFDFLKTIFNLRFAQFAKERQMGQ